MPVPVGLLFAGIPDIEEGQEIRLMILELFVGQVCICLLFKRSFPWILNAQRRYNDGNFTHTMPPVRFDDDAG